MLLVGSQVLWSVAAAAKELCNKFQLEFTLFYTREFRFPMRIIQAGLFFGFHGYACRLCVVCPLCVSIGRVLFFSQLTSTLQRTKRKQPRFFRIFPSRFFLLLGKSLGARWNFPLFFFLISGLTFCGMMSPAFFTTQFHCVVHVLFSLLFFLIKSSVVFSFKVFLLHFYEIFKY